MGVVMSSTIGRAVVGLRKLMTERRALYKIGDVVKLINSDTPMLITGYVLDKDGYLTEYEITPVSSLMYCTATMIAGLEDNE